MPKTGRKSLEMKAVQIDDETIYLVSWPIDEELDEPLPAPCEAVLRGMLSGESNAAIVKERGTSPRTIANQVAALLRQFQVSSRHELVAALARRRASRHGAS